MKILITGAAGFSGSSAAREFLREGHTVFGIDNFNDYYNPDFKRYNVKGLKIKLYENDIREFDKIEPIFRKDNVDCVVHLAAMVGVRPSIENPLPYEEVNIRGTLNLLELSKKYRVKKFIFASSSSVYGNKDKVPFIETDSANSQISPYAASKKAGELMAYTYNHLYKIPTICLRFFTVYGPRGRPDMAPYKFVDRIANDKEIEMYGDGSTKRDYTYIGDIVDGIKKSVNADLNFEIINLGCGSPILLKDFIKIIENNIGRNAKIIQMDKQLGDVDQTYADISKAKKLLGYSPVTKIDNGIRILCKWYLDDRLKK